MSPKQQLLEVASDPSNLNSTALILSGYDPSDPNSRQNMNFRQAGPLFMVIFIMEPMDAYTILKAI